VDGPGIRTTVFMKGCPLDCMWCQNPETISYYTEQHRDSKDCLLCFGCMESCDQNAITYDGDFRFDPEKCINCHDCEQNCPAQILKLNGYHLKTEKLLELLLRDRVYYQVSGGGVSFSGGEPMIHIDYLSPVVRGLKKEGIHVAIQTSGYFNFDHFQQKLQHNIDLIYYDLKLMDGESHKRYTGKNNDLILSNLKKISDANSNRIIVRTPLIPGITDTNENLEQIKSFLKSLDINEHELLPFNPAGKAVGIQRIKTQ
jgi:pyruvate formate lyase activating enzyme